MTVELIVAGASMFTALSAAGGVVAVFVKNGKSQAARDASLEANQKVIISRLNDPNQGLTAINEKVGKMTNHCAQVSTAYGERLNAAERDIKELKSKDKQN